MKKIELTDEEAKGLELLVSDARKGFWESVVKLEFGNDVSLEEAISEAGKHWTVIACTDLIEKITGSRDESYLLELAEEAREALTPPEWWGAYCKHGSAAFGPL